MREPRKIRRRSDLRWALLFIAPNLCGFLAFVALPVVFSLFMAFTNWDLLGRAPFQVVGLENFRDMLVGSESKRFWKFLTNTIYLMLGMPFGIAASLFLAVLLSEPLTLGRRWIKPLLIFAAIVPGAGLSAYCFAHGYHTAGFAIAVVSASGLIGLVFARVGFRTLLYLPFFTSGVALFILWKNLFNPEFGLVNAIINSVGGALRDLGRLTPPWAADGVMGLVLVGGALVIAARIRRKLGALPLDASPLATVGVVAKSLPWFVVFGSLAWFAHRLPGFGGLTWEAPTWLNSTRNLLGLDPETVLPSSWADAKRNFGLGAREALIIMGFCTAIGGNNMLLYLAGLSNVPQDLYEAAMIDGAGRWAKFRHVSWPQLAPTTFFIVIMSVIGGLQGGFEQVAVMVERRAAETAVTLGYYIYIEGFTEFRLGYASAVAWAMFVLIFLVTLFNWRFGSRQINV
jgi:multiple sugar transport system permease protein